MLKEGSGKYLPTGVRFFFPLGRDVAGGSSAPFAMAAASVCLVTIETALRKSGELMVIPGTNEKGSRRTGMEEARPSVEEIYELQDKNLDEKMRHTLVNVHRRLLGDDGLLDGR
jgi:hypothetical protein